MSFLAFSFSIARHIRSAGLQILLVTGANKSVVSSGLKVPMLLAVLVITDNEFQIVGAALKKSKTQNQKMCVAGVEV